MPMERERYPKDWASIALKVKVDAGWKCQECGRPCRRPDESMGQFRQRLGRKWKPQLVEKKSDYEQTGELQYRAQRFLLTVTHLDQKPSNCAPENLRALCAPCHLRYDRRFLSANRMRKLERNGQLNLFEPDTGGDSAPC